MSHAVQSQADVGTLSLARLSAFSSILATLSADSVVPMALIQMAELGAALPISGEYADKVKSLLQRCSDVRLDHLAVVVGWRKNDSASLMAESAGGQAIALVSMCLMNLFWRNNTGTILSRLCSRLLSGSMNVSSVSQLADAARILSGKLNMLGFGNMLAREVTKIHQVYEALSKPAPQDLLESLDPESAIEILESVSRALREDQKLCRISGSRGMGHILGLLQALFRRNITLTVEGTIIQDIEHSSIVCEIIQRDRSEPTQIHLETCLLTSKPIQLPITPLKSVYTDEPYIFNWIGCIADRLQLTFLNYGFKCDQAILDACGDLLVLVPAAIRVSPTTSWKYGISQPMRLLPLLGPLPRARICKICEEILCSKPTTSQMDLSTAFSNLVATVASQLQGMSCVCEDALECDWMSDWSVEALFKSSRPGCTLHLVWEAIGFPLSSALWCFFINVGPNTVIFPSNLLNHKIIVPAITRRNLTIDVSEVVHSVMQLVDDTERDSRSPIAISSASCTIYPTILKTLSVPSYQSVTYTVVEGILLFEGRYYRRLYADKQYGPRPKTSRPETGRSVLQEDYTRPSFNEIHISSPSLTIRENFDHLEVLCSFKHSGSDVKVDLEKVPEGYMGMRWTDTCHHPTTYDICLDNTKFNITSITSSAAAEGLYGVVVARWNPVAQFLCCEHGHQATLVKDCCLHCAAEGITARDPVVFILG